LPAIRHRNRKKTEPQHPSNSNSIPNRSTPLPRRLSTLGVTL
jgi:hypothetical protein